LTDARRLLTAALLDVAETRLELGQPLPTPNPSATDAEMDFEEPIYLHLSASSEVEQTPGTLRLDVRGIGVAHGL
jgi:hypothetical protein